MSIVYYVSVKLCVLLNLDFNIVNVYEIVYSALSFVFVL